MHFAVELGHEFTVQLFLPHITIEMALALNNSYHQVCKARCQQTRHVDLQQRVLIECVSLDHFLLPEIAGIVCQFLGTQTPKPKIKKKNKKLTTTQTSNPNHKPKPQTQNH